MKIIYKSALNIEQIKDRNKKDIDGIEVHLLGDDDFNLCKLFKHRIYNFHFPVKWCFLSNIVKMAANKDKYLFKTIKKCQELNAALVIHCDITLEEFTSMKEYEDFITFIKKSSII